MPLYEFCCESCGNFEVWRSLAEYDNPTYCPTCETAAKRIFSPPNINLNSGGVKRREIKEPELIKREVKAKKTSYKSQACGRPWMISH
ncbi:MAG: zinc ribbon domain-containing protein [Oscillatoria sp. PMC 1051.18]|nr:zinc ribbon domain-containing protein [Oscillatoria sp. PMC 1050.18]MEC5028811.1 zinc ribbon domain-containing protein [Oscillatoria sp. PMC 1051.18]